MKMSKYLKLYDNNAIIITRTGCHEHRNAPNRYKTVGLYENTLKLFVKEHQQIYFLFFNESSSYLNKEISHLCNNKRCINISHLCLEPYSLHMANIQNVFCKQIYFKGSLRPCQTRLHLRPCQTLIPHPPILDLRYGIDQTLGGWRMIFLNATMKHGFMINRPNHSFQTTCLQL